MVQTPRRILLVDNDKDVLASVGYRLKIEGYEVLTADSVRAVSQLMKREIFHLAIIDIRLEDEKHKADTSGFNVARELPGNVPCLIYTAYENKQNIRQALGQVGAKEIVDKTRPDAPAKLVDIVNRLFDSDIKVNFNLKIEGDFNPDRIAARIEIPASDKLLQPSAQDVRHVLQTLFYDASGVHVAPLLSPEAAPTLTQSGSVLLQARPHFQNGWGAPVAIKFSSRDEVAREAGNYRLLKPFLGGQRLAVLEHEAYARQIGGLVYSLIGASDWEVICTFGELFLTEEAETVTGLLERFFGQTFRALFAGAPQALLNLTASYTEALHLTPAKLQAAVAEFHPQALAETRLQFKGLPGSFRNPIAWALPGGQFRRFEVVSRRCLCHGDLHSRNILVDGDGHFWLIDFARVAESHALRDFVELETDIKFNLLPVVDLQALLRFEQALLAPANFRETPQPLSLANGRLNHAYQVVLALRRTAFELIDLTGDMRQYYQALFLHTLNMMRLRHISPGKKEHALLSAALICQRLQDWPNWRAPSWPLAPPESADNVNNQATDNPGLSPLPPGQLRLMGAAAGFVITLIPYIILYWVIQNYLTALLVLIVLAIIALVIAGLITGKDALLFLGELVKRFLAKSGI